LRRWVNWPTTWAPAVRANSRSSASRSSTVQPEAWGSATATSTARWPPVSGVRFTPLREICLLLKLPVPPSAGMGHLLAKGVWCLNYSTAAPSPLAYPLVHRGPEQVHSSPGQDFCTQGQGLFIEVEAGMMMGLLLPFLLAGAQEQVGAGHLPAVVGEIVGQEHGPLYLEALGPQEGPGRAGQDAGHPGIVDQGRKPGPEGNPVLGA